MCFRKATRRSTESALEEGRLQRGGQGGRGDRGWRGDRGMEGEGGGGRGGPCSRQGQWQVGGGDEIQDITCGTVAASYGEAEEGEEGS